MQFNNSFSVAKPIDEVWNTIIDIEKVVPCVPGASVLGKNGNQFTAAIKIKMGAMSMNYKGPVEIVSADANSKTAVMKASATEAGGQGHAQAEVTIKLSPGGSGTNGQISSNVAVSGKAAQMGEGVIMGVTEGLIGAFTSKLATL